MHDATPYLRRVVFAIEIRVTPPDPALVPEQDGLPGIRRSQKRFDLLSRSTIHYRGDLIERFFQRTDTVMVTLRTYEQQSKQTTGSILHKRSSKRARGRAQTGGKLAGLTLCSDEPGERFRAAQELSSPGSLMTVTTGST